MKNPSLQPDCIRRIASFDAVYPKEILKAAESLHAAGVGAVCHARRMDQPLVFIEPSPNFLREATLGP